jgi:hypothetical protein
MELSFIGKLIEKWIINKSIGRLIEISLYWFCISFLAYLGDSLTSGVRSNRRVALGGMFTTLTVWIISGIQKDIRDKLKEKEAMVDLIVASDESVNREKAWLEEQTDLESTKA